MRHRPGAACVVHAYGLCASQPQLHALASTPPSPSISLKVHGITDLTTNPTPKVHGFTDEAITFAVALERHLDLRLEISEMWRCRETVLSTHPDPDPDPDPDLHTNPGPDPGPDPGLNPDANPDPDPDPDPDH